MKDLEYNKIAAAVLLGGLIAMFSGTIADILYHPIEKPAKRGFSVAVTDNAGGAAAPAEDKEVQLGLLMASASADAGKAITSKCAACHDFSKGGPAKVGPNLWGIVGNKHAHMEGYAYSDAMKAQTGPWDYAALFKFLHNPKLAVPGTKMGFAGLSDPKDEANVLAYLRSLSDSPVPLPDKTLVVK